jgi:aminoglycoside 3-N-acetyltransferase
MSKFRGWLRRQIPNVLLQWYRGKKKAAVRMALEQDARTGKIITVRDLEIQFRSIGIQENDAVLVHASMSKIGFLENGPETFVTALSNVVGSQGHILMPTSPNAGYQIDYIQSLPYFDVANTPSKLGAISEYFRQLHGAVRSASATEPVSCTGPNAAWYTEGHLGEITPYTSNSPFARLAQKKGKILYVGVTLDNAGTSLHLLEDAVPNFNFPVYAPLTYPVKLKLADGSVVETLTKVHNPEQSAKRKCDGLIPYFQSKGVLTQVTIGKAPTLLVDAIGMFDAMLEGYEKHGITMYTPTGKE